MKMKIGILAVFIWVSLAISAKVTLPAIFTEHMVLQQQAVNKICGKAEANRPIELLTSWDNKTYTAKSNSQGYFQFEITTPSAGGPYTLTVSDGEPLIINDILIGEVWFCSGQSNMNR